MLKQTENMNNGFKPFYRNRKLFSEVHQYNSFYKNITCEMVKIACLQKQALSKFAIGFRSHEYSYIQCILI